MTSTENKSDGSVPPLCGYEVVRKPEFAIEWSEYDGKKHYRPPARLHGRAYPGVQRMEWVEIIEPYYQKTAPQHIHDLYKEIRSNATDTTGFRPTYKLEDAKTLLAYSNRDNNHNEIISVHSDWLHKIKNVPPIRQPQIEYLGYDYVVLGEWSLLEAGLYRAYEHFAQWEEYLNPYGLFVDDSVLEDYCEHYLQLARREIVEEIGDEDSVFEHLDAILIGKPVK